MFLLNGRNKINKELWILFFMKRKTLVGIIAGIAIGIGALVGTLNRDNKTPQSRIICEYTDRDNNGKYDEYRLLKMTKDSSEYLNLGIPYNIGFASPLGGSYVSGEFDREILETMFNKYNFPDVDEIKFVNSKSNP